MSKLIFFISKLGYNAFMAKFELFKGPYNPQIAEQAVLNFWGANKFFKPEYNAVEKVVDEKRPMPTEVVADPLNVLAHHGVIVRDKNTYSLSHDSRPQE